MSILPNIYYYISKSIIGSIFSKAINSCPNIILAYHGVQNIRHSNCINTEIFKNQMEYIKEEYDILPLDDLVQQHRKNVTRPTIAITFDDAYCNLLENAIPILSELSIPSTIYVPSKHIGGKNEWDKYSNEQILPILSEQALKALIRSNKNITLGSHTASHKRLCTLTKNEMESEIFGSKKSLEDMFGIQINSIAYPYGRRLDYDNNVLELVQKAGYHFALSTRFGRFLKEDERWQLPRVRVWDNDDMERFKMKLHGNYDWLSFKEDIAYILKSKHIVFTKKT